MPVQINAPPAEAHPFHLQAQPLLERMLAGDANRAARPDHTMPGQALKHVERPDHLPRRTRESSRRGDLAVGRDFAARDLPDHSREND